MSDPADVARHDQMASLVERMLELHKRLASRVSADREMYQRQIAGQPLPEGCAACQVRTLADATLGMSHSA